MVWPTEILGNARSAADPAEGEVLLSYRLKNGIEKNFIGCKTLARAGRGHCQR